MIWLKVVVVTLAGVCVLLLVGAVMIGSVLEQEELPTLILLTGIVILPPLFLMTN